MALLQRQLLLITCTEFTHPVQKPEAKPASPEKEAAGMRPGSMSSSTGGAATNLWHGPIPYLFGGMGAMMVLIAVALMVLACSHWKSSRRASAEAAAAAAAAAEKAAVIPLDMEPRIVVIMAGDDKPTYLAKPFSSSAPPALLHLPTPVNGEP